MHVVWFKRDLRVADHAVLHEAAQRGPTLPLYIVEPDLWQQPDMSARHWAFVSETLTELRDALGRLGQPLVVRTGPAVQVLDDLHQAGQLVTLWSHEETGNAWTFRRDVDVGAWCRAHGVAWNERQNHGVWRRLKTRNGWAKSWDQFMAQPCVPTSALVPVDIDPGVIPQAKDLSLEATGCPDRQIGGRRAGLERLTSFLEHRGKTYQRAMSTPLEGAEACSRLSPYLAWGALSMREVSQATQTRKRALARGESEWRKSMRSFTGRLHWHCHFIQKLEDDPRIEVENFHKLYDGLRPAVPDQERLDRWIAGETGYPFLDACMRSLRATGWLNFRMRAMVMATASYHLWLDWRAPGLHLAQMFTDYEPGIHWSQVQMQSGTTGINTIRIYNPVKQGHEQDPTGAFTRKWIPELADIPDAHLQEPWASETSDRVIGSAYPERLFDHVAAARAARERVWSVRRNPAFRSEAQAIQAKHGSRKSGIPNRGQRGAKKDTDQLPLPLGDTS